MRQFVTLALVANLALATLPALAQEAETSPPWSQADEYYDPVEMAAAREAVQAGSGHQTDWYVQIDRFETQFGGDENTQVWDTQGWYGGDINKLWFKAEGEYSFGTDEIEDAELQALWSRAISPYFDFQAGVRYDFEPGGRTHTVVGVQGLAPYWFELDAAAFVSTKGDVTARIEAEYEFLLSQRLILQPRAEINLSAQDIPELQIGSGITNIEAGLRLRYEFVREFAPYIGVAWQSSLGETADIIKAAGGETARTVFVLGIRAWY
jgi:copper resistance protein B